MSKAPKSSIWSSISEKTSQSFRSFSAPIKEQYQKSVEENIPEPQRRAIAEDKKRRQLLEAWLAPDFTDDDLELLQYDPIPHQDMHMVRLVQLLPGKDWEPIEVVFDVSPLDVEYEALSYCWGDVSRRSPIVCNGKRLFITPNLKSALRDLRRPDTPRLFWIDAICINQADISEREQQVRIMHDIYSCATRTVIWLGETFPGNETAFAMLQRVYDLFYHMIEDGSFDFNAVLFEDAVLPIFKQETMPTDEEMHAFLQLLKRDWWHRVWVIQEVALAKAVYVTCGEMEMDWHMFWGGALVAFFLGWHGTQARTRFFGSLFHLKFARDGAQDDEESGELDLLILLRNFREFSATDPRDKAFALYGMTNSSLEDMGLTINYTAKPEDVYLEVAKGILKTCDTLDILSITRSHSALAEKLPSWVPDWSDQSKQLQPYFAREEVSSKESPVTPFNATGASTLPVPVVSVTNRLTLRGFQLDTVKTLSTPIPNTSFDIEALQSRTAAITETGRGFRALYRYAFTALNETAAQRDAFAEIDAIVLGQKRERALEKYMSTEETIEYALVRTLAGDFAPQGQENVVEAYKTWRRERWANDMMRSAKIDRLPKLYKNLTSVATLLPDRSDTQPFAGLVEEALGRSICWTEQGRLAMVPPGTQMGDEVWLIQGCRMPIILRRVEQSGGARELVGDSYVHGVMYGEAFDQVKCKDVTLV